MKPHKKTLLICGIIGMTAALLGCLADVLLLFVPNGGYENWDYRFFHQISSKRLLWGHYLGVLLIPFELAGLYVVGYGLQPAGKKWLYALGAAILYVMIIGVAYHGMLALYASALHLGTGVLDAAIAQQIGEGVKQMSAFFEPLGFLMFLVFAPLSLCFFYLVWAKKTHFPRWVALVNPLIVYAVITLIYLLFPTWGAALMVAGFNLSLLLLFAVTTGVLVGRDLTQHKSA